LLKKDRLWKLNASKPYIDEFTVFIIVKIESLKELSKSIPLKDNKALKKNKEITKAIIDKKYL
tara:strand:- start:205 stop:393 length:189 start_codon:yes stop_codon:yes gene_type:complete